MTKNRSEKLYENHYSKENVLNYEKSRINSRWIQEQEYVEKILTNYKSINYSIIDAPIGTNRFCDIFKKQLNVNKIYGFDYSQEMLDASASKNTSNLFLEKLDLVEQPIPVQCEVSICSRILNLFNEQDSIRILSNVLNSTLDICIVSIRTHKSNSLHYNDKLYCHSEEVFSQLFRDKNFVISDEKRLPRDHKPGIMRLLTLSKK